MCKFAFFLYAVRIYNMPTNLKQLINNRNEQNFYFNRDVCVRHRRSFC